MIIHRCLFMQIYIKYVIDVDHDDIVYGLSEASQGELVTSTPDKPANLGV